MKAEYCHRCGRITPTVYLQLSSGHIGNCCAACHSNRKGRPFVSHAEYEQNRTDAIIGRRGQHATIQS